MPNPECVHCYVVRSQEASITKLVKAVEAILHATTVEELCIARENARTLARKLKREGA